MYDTQVLFASHFSVHPPPPPTRPPFSHRSSNMSKPSLTPLTVWHLNYTKCNRHCSQKPIWRCSIVCGMYMHTAYIIVLLQAEIHGWSGFHSWNLSLPRMPMFNFLFSLFTTHEHVMVEEIFLKMWKAYVRFGTFTLEFLLRSSLSLYTGCFI